jgi:hypothetical protein
VDLLLPPLVVGELSESHVVCCSPDVRRFFVWGESEGVNTRFSLRDTALLSVSAVEVAELDMRLEEYSTSVSAGIIMAGDANGESSTNGVESPLGSSRENWS